MGDAFVSPEKQRQLTERMLKLGIREADLVERFILGSGRGGQKINKTSSCVYLRHIRSGIEIKCQQDRSRAMNRYSARRLLCEELETRTLGEASVRRQQEEKVRRQKRRRSRRQRARMLEAKRHHSAQKQMRGPLRAAED